MATFSVHFDGPITIEHKVTVRVLAKTYEHMQRAIDRAYLINTYGEVWKHARLKANQYPETEFIAAYPREGGIFLDAVREGAGPIIDRVVAAVRPVFEASAAQAVDQFIGIDAQFGERERYVQQIGRDIASFERVSENPPPQWASAYSNRAIVKEIDQLVGIITPQRVDGSVVDITLSGTQPNLPFRFSPEIAKRFHSLAARRELGPAMTIRARIRALDRGNKFAKPSAKIENLSSGREVNLLLHRRSDVNELHPHHDGREVVLIVAPVIEAMGFDVKGGDLMFLRVA